jgi:putative transposase
VAQAGKRRAVSAAATATRIRQKLQAAYDQPTYERARKALQKVRREVALRNLSAAASLDEGFEETLTLASRTDKVDHWKTSEQKQRWVATALLDLEPRLHRVKHFEALPDLQRALARATRMATKEHAA